MRILLVAPYPEMAALSQSLPDNCLESMQTVVGNLVDGFRVAEQAIAEDDIGIVVSRGHTADLLRENLSLPVLEIGVSDNDVLRIVLPLIKGKKSVAFVGHASIIDSSQSLAKILGTEMGYFPTPTPGSEERCLDRALEWGADVVLGDTVADAVAARRGVSHEMIRSGAGALRLAVQTGMALLRSERERFQTERRLQAVVDHVEDGVMFVQRDGRVDFANVHTQDILGLTNHGLIGDRLSDGGVPSSLVTAVREGCRNHRISIYGRKVGVDVVNVNGDAASVEKLVFLRRSKANISGDYDGRSTADYGGLAAQWTFERIIAADPLFRRVVEKAKNCSLTESTVLLQGETGVGKEMFAQSIHNASRRRNGPFVGVNCAALTESLLESELFGYAEGAFTGARKGGKPGLFEMAQNGTIFLDEVNDMSKVLQLGLLRVLQERKVMRVGGNRVRDVNVRLITASNKNLFEETRSGRFREDLYYRLKVFDIEIPPLRNRRRDIQPLFQSFLEHFTAAHSFQPQSIPQSLIEAVISFPWPGNVRQLYNFAEKVVVLLATGHNRTEIVDDLLGELGGSAAGYAPSQAPRIQGPLEPRTLKEMESAYIRECWERNLRNVSRTARELGIDRATVRKYVVSSPAVSNAGQR